MPPLEEIIRDEIRTSGPMRFDRFMELALYHPNLGYYAKNPVIGRKGDFYTSVSVGPLFGRLLARQFLEMWQLLGRPEPFWIIEQGAHDGQLARDILEWCRERTEMPEFGRSLRYGIVNGPKIKGTVALELNQLRHEKPVGVFFSNELVDSFPVRAITYRNGEWLERHVNVGNDGVTWLDRPVDDPDLAQLIVRLRIPAIEGYTTEIHLKARGWMDHVARAMQRGHVVTIDYGYTEREYYASHRTAGTLTAYAKHRRVDNVLAHPGEQDITAHVNFTALMETGRSQNLKPIGFLDQQRFLTGIAHDELNGATSLRAGISDSIRSWNSLTHPEHLGTRFRVLIQAKNAPAKLAGLRFARPSDL